MRPVDLAAFSQQHFQGDLKSAIQVLLTMQPPAKYHWSTTYCTAKAFVALWACALAPKLPTGMTVNAVSPGNAPSTNAARHQPLPFRMVMKIVAVVGPAMGIAAPASKAAGRYLEAAAMNDDVTGQFFASPKGQLVGPLTRQEVPHLCNPASARACWDVLTAMTGESVLSSASS
jgi:NAD(P)-dependent dehydrogenase (short-subunit alcohol dehydrogenase family)